jgi:hypothetical protein
MTQSRIKLNIITVSSITQQTYIQGQQLNSRGFENSNLTMTLNSVESPLFLLSLSVLTFKNILMF